MCQLPRDSQLGIFSVSVVTLGATGWAIVDQVHTGSPSFLHDHVDGGSHIS